MTKARRPDLTTVVKMSQAVSEEIVLDRLIERLLMIAVEHAGAVRGLLVLPRENELRIEAEVTTSRTGVKIFLRQEAPTSEELPESIIRHVIRTHESVILNDALTPNPFSTDIYVRRKLPRSVLCLPLLKQARLIGVLYLENDLTSHVFTGSRVAELLLLASQAAISLENARLYAASEEAFSLDIEDLKHAKALLAGEKRLLEMIGTGHALPAILETLCIIVEELNEGSPASVLLLDPDAKRLRTGAAPNLPDRYSRAIDGIPIGPAAGSCGTAAYLGARVFVADVMTDPLWEDYRTIALEHGLRACWSAPILSGAGAVLGTIAIYSREARQITSREIRIMERFTHVASIVIGAFGRRKRAEEELRRREADLRKAQAELAHVTRLTTMGELAASIAHEVNQPIAGVVLNANTCLRRLARVEGDSVNLAKAREAAERIVRDGKRAGEVIARIRALFQKEDPAKEPLDLNETIKEIIVLARHEMDKQGVSLRWELASDLPLVLGDRVQLQQVILNLILNAIDAMSAVEGRSRDLIIQTRRRGEGQASVTVRDSGIGLDPAKMEQIFTAFHTTKPKGLGMGLSISRSIVENHAGRLWATAHDGPGASFHFTLPTTSRAEP